MKKISNITPTVYGYFLILIMIVSGGCADELLYNPDDFENGDGSIRMSLSFEPLNGVDLATRTPGNAIHDIESLAIVFFNTEGGLIKIVNQGDPEIKDWSLEQNANTSMPADAPEGSQSEVQTPRATFRLENLNIPYGRYHIYAVANMGKITSSEADPLTEEKLKSTILTWESDVRLNNQMFGYFTAVTNAGDQGAMPEGFGPQEIVIKENTSPRLHSWLRRAASKVTIAYDGSGLYDNVRVFINKVTIRDIPKNCYLGEYNKPESETALIPEGGTLYYGKSGIVSPAEASSDHEQWLKLTNDNKKPIGTDHSENAEALFFYENMQGDFSSKPEEERKKYDKKQTGSPKLGVLVDPDDPDYKDEVPFGTWIEVEAYYESENNLNLGKGKIIYRFMLGMDVDYNYDAERNHHFKLTLVLKGWANQADWHIEFTQEDPALIVPPDFYMPYLYNQKSMLPVKLNGNAQSLTITIKENGWAPVSPTTHQVPAQTVGDFTWNVQAYDAYGPEKYAQLGFLALAVPNETGEPATNIVPETTATKENREEGRKELNKLYEERFTAEGGYVWSQKYREYDVSPGLHQIGNNQYTVTKADEGESYSFQIPLWTRNKTMIENSGYTGNNPYEAYERKAIIEIKATFKTSNGTEVKTERVPIYQTRRIVNPKGVWRSYKDNQSFNVHLMTLNSPKDTEYTPLSSDGSWKAYIESDQIGFCHLEDMGGTKQDTVRGADSEIKFDIAFDGVVTSGNSQGCIVSVVYNGGSCIHKILVRQGYDEALEIVPGGAKWSSFNLYSCETGHNGATDSDIIQAELSCNPLGIGSLFKRRNYSDAILVSNNNTYGPLIPLNGNKLKVKSMGESDREETWAEIDAYPATTLKWGANSASGVVDTTAIVSDNSTRWARFKAIPSGSSQAKTYRVPTYDDYKALDDMEFAVGIVYADGATGTLKTFDAYGYEDGNNDLDTSPKGMRGFIVYNKTTGNQIFFPLGKYGMARRTQAILANLDERGYLRYAGTNKVLSGDNNLWRPIPYDMPHCPGSIYWINNVMIGKQYHSDGASAGWDMNYFSLDFSSYSYQNVNDAGPVKLIRVD